MQIDLQPLTSQSRCELGVRSDTSNNKMIIGNEK